MKRLVFAFSLIVIGIVSIIGMNILPNEIVDNPTAEGSSGKVSFSHSEGFYSQDISVSLSIGDENSQIYYTTDGKSPITDGKLYKKPIPMSAKAIGGVETLKVSAKIGEEFTPIITKSYVLCTDFDQRFTDETLIFVLSTDPDNLYNYETGIAVKGKVYDDWLENEYKGGEIPYNAPGNYFMTGREWEREMHVEVFTQDGSRVINQLAGAKTVGGYSRAVDQKSFKLIARKSYDPENGKFKYPFFPDAKDASGMQIAEFDRIVLRNGANDREFAGVRDELSGELARQAGFPSTQNAVPAAVFLNGEYYGYSWVHENYNEDYLATQFGGEKDNYQVVQNTEEGKEGDEKAVADYAKAYALLEKDMTNDKIFEEFCELVDIDNYMMYAAIQIYIDNLDWPGNNFKAFRYYPTEGEENLTEWQDGKWRFLLFDVEFAWSLYGNTVNNRMLSNLISGRHQSGYSRYIDSLMKREDMQAKLSSLLMDLANHSFGVSNVNKVLDEKIDISDNEQMFALDKGYTSHWANRDTFADSRRQIREFASQRKNVVVKDLTRNFDLSGEFYDVNLTGANGAKAWLNTLSVLDEESVKNQYFIEHSVPVYAEVYAGYTFSHWEVNGKTITDEKLMISKNDLVNDEVNIQLFVKKSEDFSQIQISEIYTSGNADWIKLYNPNNFEITLENMYLSDNLEVINRFRIPTITIKANESLTIVCNNNKDSSSLLKIKANFSLKEGETLVLSDRNGKIIESVVIPKLDKSQSYFRKSDGSFSPKSVEG